MGLDIDGRADHYALVATAYHLLTVRSCSRTPIPGSEVDFRDTAPRRSLAPAPGCAGVAYVVSFETPIMSCGDSLGGTPGPSPVSRSSPPACSLPRRLG
jgi:hypothetical protein